MQAEILQFPEPEPLRCPTCGNPDMNIINGRIYCNDTTCPNNTQEVKPE